MVSPERWVLICSVVQLVLSLTIVIALSAHFEHGSFFQWEVRSNARRKGTARYVRVLHRSLALLAHVHCVAAHGDPFAQQPS